MENKEEVKDASIFEIIIFFVVVISVMVSLFLTCFMGKGQ